MRNLKLTPIMLCIFILNVASMCSSDSSSSSSSDPTPVINTANSGTWKITLYDDSGEIKTNNFTNYNFTFGTGNVLTASNGTNTYTGSWSVTSSDNSNDDNPDSDLDFNILFSSPANFADLSDDWDVVSYTANTITLIDVSGGNGGTDYLTFTKN
jgi:hypothetical protein